MLKVIKQLRTIPKLGQEQSGMHYSDQQNEFYKKQKAIVDLRKVRKTAKLTYADCSYQGVEGVRYARRIAWKWKVNLC